MSADIIIIGGGIVGSSIAFNLLENGSAGSVVVMERDSSYQFASSALAFGGVRQQFMSDVNVRMVRYSRSHYSSPPATLSMPAATAVDVRLPSSR
jgi:FAD-dependent oxidoreductase domain-containing protein 1